MTIVSPSIRRKILDGLRAINRLMRIQTNVWGTLATGMKFSDPEFPHGRKIRPSEKPENRLETWRQLYADMDDIIGVASLIRDVADRHVQDLQRRDILRPDAQDFG